MYQRFKDGKEKKKRISNEGKRNIRSKRHQVELFKVKRKVSSGKKDKKRKKKNYLLEKNPKS